MIEFNLYVKPVTKKNSSRIVRSKTGRLFLLPSKQYQAFEKEVLPTLTRVKNKYGVIDYPVNIECVFYMATKHKVDLANLLNAVDDAMVTSGLLKDDNRDIVIGHDFSRVFYDKENPRIEIKITPYKNYEQWKIKK
jgi:Holliday junction resolvase RusA-like endonuclease